MTASLYQALLTRGTSPALTWYDADGRIELSGKVLANHVAKIANYLADECGLEPGDELALDLPLHWKTLAWALGGIVAGARVTVGTDGSVVVTTDPQVEAGGEIVALNLDSFAFAWHGQLPDGVADGAAEVMAQPDTLMIAEELANVERVRAGRAISQASVLVKPTIADAVTALVAASAGGSIVVVGDDRDPARVAEVERATLL
ncbi:TIGR03089 family protein [Trueperella pyogenes]|uniref:TIGR03089 family protein n=1 Tax=Trueperella pyogenes TaxID=1661 RepID=UPI0021685127|nr:TIGR03089 family protein [Trueperella pyogenes]UVJ57326.1 TIGR03089 family protein [Trueperella pyogenes]